MVKMKEEAFYFSSGGCSWAKCYFCGYGKIRGPEATFENCKRQIDGFFEKIGYKTKRIRVFGSGSFLDEKQFPKKARTYFLEKCKKAGIKNILFESRPEFINGGVLKDFKDFYYTVAIGLEVADDLMLKGINKGITLAGYIKATKIVKKNKGIIRSYLLVNLPFVKNQEASLKKSVDFALKYGDEVVLINLYPHYNASIINDYLKLKWKPLNKKQFGKLTKRWKNNKRVGLDFQTFMFYPKFPAQKPLVGVGLNYLKHPYFEVWQDYFEDFYAKPFVKEYALFLPCSYRKPYSLSKTHAPIIKYLKMLHFYAKIHQIMISNCGVIPREFENKYPFNAYDWNEGKETKKIKELYIKINEVRIERYLKKHKYKKVFAYLKPSSESYVALEKACKRLKIKLTDCTKRDKKYETASDLIKRESLENLLKVLGSEIRG